METAIQAGSYAGYIWAAYGVSVIALGALTFMSWRAYRAALARAADLSGNEGA